MRRRAILAVLLVVALVALVLARYGGTDRREAETTQGSPFTGGSGVTRSVAWISKQQRYLDAHPELARQGAKAAREAAAEEAAREGAATGVTGSARAERVGTNIREKPEPG